VVETNNKKFLKYALNSLLTYYRTAHTTHMHSGSKINV